MTKYQDVKFETNDYERNQAYYTTERYNILATDSKVEEYSLCDGGFTDWTQKTLSNKKKDSRSTALG